MSEIQKFMAAFIGVFFLAAFCARAEINKSLGYQGYLVSKSASDYVNGAKDMKFILYDAPAAGTELFSETRCDVPVVNGRYFVEIGSNTLGGVPGSVFSSGSGVWLEVQIDPDDDCAGTFEAMVPRIKLQSYPYSFNSLYASTASAATSVFRADIIDSLPGTTYGAVTISTNLFVQGGISVGEISPGQKLIVAGPIESTTGGFVFPDGSVQTKASALTKWDLNVEHLYTINEGFVGVGTGPNPLAQLHVSSGAGETGNIFLVSTGTSNLFRVTGEGKAYASYFYGDGSGLTGVQGTDQNRVLKTGDTMSGNLTISGSSLTIIGNGAGMSNSLEITTDPAKGVYHFVISTSGYAGVGTGAPLYPLHLSKSGYQGVMLAVSSGTGNSVEIKGNGDIVAKTYYGDGSNLQNVNTVDNTKVLKTGDTMSGSLTISGSSLTVGGEGSFSGHLSLGSSVTALGEIKTSSSLAAAGGFFSGAITASSGTFTLSGANQYSIETASGIKVNAGAVEAPYFAGDGSMITDVYGIDDTKVLKAGDTMSGNLTISGSSLTVLGAESDFYSLTVSPEGDPSNYDFVVTTPGKVGIGISSPSAYLDVYRQIRVVAPTLGDRAYITINSNGGPGYISWYEENLYGSGYPNQGVLGFDTGANARDFVFRAAASNMSDGREVFRVKSDEYGNWKFAIGKSTPIAPLDIGVDLAVSTGGAGSIPVLFVSTSLARVSVNMSTQSLTHALNVEGGVLITSSITAQGGFYGDVYGDIKTSSITLTGNLGLGKNDKIAKLEIQENGSEQYILVAGTNTSNLAAVEPYDFVITTAGKVGIGVANPNTYLHTRGALTIGHASDIASAYIHMKPAGGDTYISFEESASPQKGTLGFKAGSKRFKYCPDSVAICADGNEALGIEQNGNVGIGGVTPTHKLHVSGGVLATSSVTASEFYGDGSNLTGVVPLSGGTMTGNLTLSGSTLTVTGNAFSVGGSTFTVTYGKVGIGTSSPGSVLDVEGDASFGQGAAKSTFTAKGFWQPRWLTSSQLQSINPGAIGEVAGNSTINDICISTGTGLGDWALAGSKGTGGCF